MTTTQLGKYHILEEIGGGGFAAVYRAEDTTLGRIVALKILDPLLARDPHFIERFRQEARVTATLQHPHIATLFEIGESEGRHFLVTQYIPGKNLRDLVEATGLLPLDTIVSIVEHIGAALDYAHKHGVIHRDVKPSNILVDEEGQAFLTDFGIVKALETTASVRTTTGAVLGTPHYVSPEQAESKPLDGRSDLYSLGVVAYQLITGEAPHKADTTPSLYYKIVHEMPQKPSTLNARAAGPLEEMLLKALAKQPEDRYQTCAEFARALKEAADATKGNMLAVLYQEAMALFKSGEFEEAETLAQQVLTVDVHHREAQSLLQNIAAHRDYNQRYQTLAVAWQQWQAQAQELVRDYPTMPDPENLLARSGKEYAKSDKLSKKRRSAEEAALTPPVIVTPRTSSITPTDAITHSTTPSDSSKMVRKLAWWLLGISIPFLPALGVGLMGIIGARAMLKGRASGRKLGTVFAILVEIAGIGLTGVAAAAFHGGAIDVYIIVTVAASALMSAGIVLAYQLNKPEIATALGDTSQRPAWMWPLIIPCFLTIVGIWPAIALLKHKSWGKSAVNVVLLLLMTIAIGAVGVGAFVWIMIGLAKLNTSAQNRVP